MFKETINTVVDIFTNNSYINIVINQTIKQKNFSENDKKLYTKIVYGVVENKLLLDYYLKPLIQGKRVKPFLKNSLRVGAYALDFLNLAPHYVINEIVEVVKQKDYKASTFVNAILRKYQTSKKPSLDSLDEENYLSIKYSLPLYLVQLLNKQYPNQISNFFSEGEDYNIYRLNFLKTNTVEIINYLEEHQIKYLLEENQILTTKESLINTPLFQDGKICPQDKSSIMVSLIANPKPNMTVLDACSAPGSKAMHLASLMNNKGLIDAGDIHPHKLKLISENAEKLGVKIVKPHLADATCTNYPYLYDLILLDVPCSGLGVLRHKPDLKYQMTLEKINEIKKIQQKILNHTSKFLKPGGSLVYSTCTINKAENEEMIQAFLQTHPRFQKESELKILPSAKEDGFYICKLRG